MILRTAIAALVVAAAGIGALADSATMRLLDRAWPARRESRLSELGRGVGVVFSPDLSVRGNCHFYRALGFACFQSADWTAVLNEIAEHNRMKADRAVRTLVLETHGTNGNGLKLQHSSKAAAERSYISIGALQERLDPAGVKTVILSACNSGRLLRPSIYRTLDPNPGDKLFLPATCGIVNASGRYDFRRSPVTIAIPASSHIETTLVAGIRELAPQTRRVLERAAQAAGIQLPREFAVSDMMMQMIISDPKLMLSTSGAHVNELSGKVQPQAVSEALYVSFVNRLNAVAAADPDSALASGPQKSPEGRSTPNDR